MSANPKDSNLASSLQHTPRLTYAGGMNEPGGADGPVTVLTVRDPGVLALAQSLLDDAGIQYFAKGEDTRNLYPFLSWVELQVATDDAEKARALLADLAEP
jgi:hypothetical protein